MEASRTVSLGDKLSARAKEDAVAAETAEGEDPTIAAHWERPAGA
jgi:hypothetical protein